MINLEIKQTLKQSAEKFRLPRYSELPRVGLYLEQTVCYINEFLAPISCPEITASMISNYVKKGFISSPRKKQYSAEQIAYLIFIAIAKNVLPLENIVELIEMQKETYTLERAYNYFCSELENMIFFSFGIKDLPDKIENADDTEERDFLVNIIISISQSLYISAYFSHTKRNSAKGQSH